MRFVALAVLASLAVGCSDYASDEADDGNTASAADDVITRPNQLPARRLSNGRLVIHPKALPNLPDVFDPFAPPVKTDPEISSDSEWTVDLSPKFLPVRDQGDTNTCESFAFTSVLEAELGAKKHLSVEPVRSKLVLFGVDGDFDFVAGLRLNGLHVMSESHWPFNGTAAADAGDFAAAQITDSALVLPNAGDVIRALDDGKPLQFAICFDPRYAHGPTNSYLTLDGSPSAFGRRISCGIETALGHGGGHAIVIVGYKEENGSHVFKFRNSWGKDWGEDGYGRMGEGFLRKMGYVGHTIEARIDASKTADF